MGDNNKEVYTPGIGTLTQQGTGKLLNIIFIVDISGSMRFEGRIEAVNEAFTQMIPALRQIQMDCMSEFELKISIMTFDQEARWIVNSIPVTEMVVFAVLSPIVAVTVPLMIPVAVTFIFA